MPAFPTSPPTFRVCVIPECAKAAQPKSRWCSMHAGRIRRHGDPDTTLTSGPKPGANLISGNFPCACGGKTIVKDSRPQEGGIRRRRLCLTCTGRFTTIEIAADDPATATGLVDASRRGALVKRMLSVEELMTQILDELHSKVGGDD